MTATALVPGRALPEMSEPIQQLPGGDRAYDRQDLHRYYQTNAEMESSRHHIEDVDRERRALEQSEAVALFQKQIELLQRRLVSDPKFFRDAFIAEGTNAISWEFQQEELGEKFTRAFWGLLLRGDAMSSVVLRFIWGIPLKYKRKFKRAIDVHLSERYPMFKGLSEGWPGQNAIPPYHPPRRGARQGLRTGDPGLSRLHEPGLQLPRGRDARLARGAARQAVRRPALRTRGAHGTHIHAVGKCDPPGFTTTGGHLNTTGKQHRHKNPAGWHLGDVGNVVAKADGAVDATLMVRGATLASGPLSLLGPSGKTALVVHANPDDETTDPAGNAEPRIACGVLARQ